MLKTGENIDGPGRRPVCGILTVKERIGKDLTLDDKPLCLWINVKCVIDKSTNLTLRFETVPQPFFKQLLRRSACSKTADSFHFSRRYLFVVLKSFSSRL